MSKLEISLEYASLRLPGHCPLGVWVIPSPDDIHHWCGTLFIHRGYYAGGIYKFTITSHETIHLINKRPNQFQTDCFHPLIDQSNQGSFNLSLKFPNWLPHENFICNLLYYLKSCFKRPGLESIIASGDDSIAYNKHAFRSDRRVCNTRRPIITLSSSPTSLYDQPSSSSQNEDSNKRIGQKDANGDSRSSSPSKSKHLIKFNPLNDDQFKQLRQKIFLEF
ncbi:hypothetical protein H4Q26_006684 [Puccinia striiformis f. sp. tritici PST-130]|nr:hypothetical protein H4Q26_006684 [Puccinia striiformis f. sp. tritici PST-130]